MDPKFKDLKELYDRLKPALNTKASEMHRAGYVYINADDIWNYLKEIKWKRSHDLSLYEMVDNILDTNNEEIDAYLREKMNSRERHLYFDE